MTDVVPTQPSKVVTSAGRAKPPNAGKGRVKGVPNKTTTTAKAAIQSVYDRLQEGHPDPHGHFVGWAQANPGEFYAKVFPRLLPVQVTGGDEGDRPVVVEVIRKIIG